MAHSVLGCHYSPTTSDLDLSVAHQIYQRPLSTYFFVENFIADLKSIEVRAKKMLPVAVVTQRQDWAPPPEGIVKINVDVTVSKSMERGSVASIASNGRGEFMGVSATVFQGKTDAETFGIVPLWAYFQGAARCCTSKCEATRACFLIHHGQVYFQVQLSTDHYCLFTSLKN
jgi:hypothetical protein